MRKAIICDIDGVLLKGTWKGDIEQFYRDMDSCYPVDWMVDIINSIHKLGYKILFVTARDEKVRVKTKYQLKELFPFTINLYMRPRDDLRPSYVVKEEHLEKLQQNHEIIFAIDDEIANCEMFERHDIPAIHVLS